MNSSTGVSSTLAAALLVGPLLPSTPREDELMRQARDSLIEEIKGLSWRKLWRKAAASPQRPPRPWRSKSAPARAV
jgi:hypothetical protein